jgi:RNA polymerase sigma-70 factor (ECF subfamily)
MDPQAEFRGVYDAHRTAVHAYFLGRTGDRATADDLTQELFLRAWQHHSELTARNPDGQRAWLFTVARNLVIDTAWRAGSRQRAETALRAEPERSAPAASEGALAAEGVATVARAVADLPDDLRLVLTMAAAGELTSTEIGAALDVPAGTVRYRLSRARSAVAAALAAADQGHPPVQKERTSR